MISFENDYLEGAHEKVLARLIETNMVQESAMVLIHIQSKLKNVLKK